MSKKKYDRPTYTSDYFPADVNEAVFLGNVVLDNVVTTLIALATEVWSNKRRINVLEAVLEDKGVTEDMIETYMPSEEKNEKWQKQRDAFINRVFQDLNNTGGKTMATDRKFEK
ncbi:MAG: hypothetical protein RIC29_00525 [Rhodospirillaceae bacterium]